MQNIATEQERYQINFAAMEDIRWEAQLYLKNIEFIPYTNGLNIRSRYADEYE